MTTRTPRGTRGQGPAAREHEGETAGRVVARLRRIEGQVRGLERMVESGRPCEDVLTQLSAITQGLRRVGVMVLSCALTTAAAEAAEGGLDPGPAAARLAERLARLG
jgi:DNA-binding FrmR family transcriptional regulator